MNLLSSLALAIATFLPVVAHSADRWPDAFSRRGYKLGMSLTDFRKMPYADSDKQKGVYPVCSNDKKANDSGYYVKVYDETYKAAGVVSCGFYYDEKIGDKNYPYQVGIDLAGERYNTSFQFVPDADPSDLRLFDILSFGPNSAMSQFLPVLIEAYGQPAHTTEELQNGAGNNFTNDIYTWDKGGSQVRLDRYANDINTFMLDYSLDEMVKKLADFAKKSVAEKAKQL